MFEIWDVKGVSRPFDWQSTPAIRHVRPTAGYEPTDREPGTSVLDGQWAPARDPYRRAQIKEEERKSARRAVRIARDLMSSPVVHLHPESTVGEAWKMIANRRFRHLPVLSVDGALVGIISDRDLLRVAGTPDRAPRSDVADRPVRLLMKTSVYSANPDTSVRAVARVMFEERIGAMPVVDESGALIGLITRSDILRVLVNEAPMDLWV